MYGLSTCASEKAAPMHSEPPITLVLVHRAPGHQTDENYDDDDQYDDCDDADYDGIVTYKHQAYVTSFLHLRSREAHLGHICPLLWRRVIMIIIYDDDGDDDDDFGTCARGQT